VILSDALVNLALLRLARPDAEIVDAGKRGGKTSPSQDNISRVSSATPGAACACCA